MEKQNNSSYYIFGPCTKTGTRCYRYSVRSRTVKSTVRFSHPLHVCCTHALPTLLLHFDIASQRLEAGQRKFKTAGLA